MVMTSIRSIGFLLGFLLLVGCPGNEAKMLFENAAFEESQMNWTHAKDIYQDLVTRYPSSKEAELARIRLEGLKNQQ